MPSINETIGLYLISLDNIGERALVVKQTAMTEIAHGVGIQNTWAK